MIGALTLTLSGCAARRSASFAPPAPTFSEVAPRHCLLDQPEWSDRSYCRKISGEWSCYKIKARIKKDCGQLDVLQD